MTTWPLDQPSEQWPTTGTVPWRTAPDVPAADVSPTVASRAAAFDAAAPTAVRQPYLPLAWSNEQPEFVSPLPIEQPRSFFMRSRVLTVVGSGLVAAAAAGLFATLYGAHSTPVDATTSHSAPAPAPAPAPVNPAPAPANQTKTVMATHSAVASRASSGSTSHQSPSQYSTSSSSGQHANDQSGQTTNDQQWQSNQNSVSTPPTWSRNDYYWITHLRDDDSRWTRDHDSDGRSRSDHGGNSQSSHDQNSDNHSPGSGENGSLK